MFVAIESKEKQILSNLLEEAGITINGTMPYDIQVFNEDLYQAVFSRGSLGIGEAYMDGWWDVDSLDTFIEKVLKVKLEHKIRRPDFVFTLLKSRILNLQSPSRSKKVAEIHYNLGNELYELMLDKHMQYTCAYWDKAPNLEKAQEDKLDMICKKIQLKSSDHVLELGCGWGGFARFAAENYGCRVTGFNISRQQVEWAREKCRGLNVDFCLQDYREAKGTYDKVVSIGLCEHIGFKNYNTFFSLIQNCLKEDGLALVHTIVQNRTGYTTDAWLDKYIFPGSQIPSPVQLAGAFISKLTMLDWHYFGLDYDKTLMAWFENFDNNWHRIKSGKYNDRFYRMWKYYLLVCAGSFRAEKNQLCQIVLSKRNITGHYKIVR